MSQSTDPSPALIWTLPEPPPRQRSLGRAEIVAAAIAVADEAGAEAVTMKAVAARLGPFSPMALYRYVHSKEGLVDLMLDAATAEIPLPAEPSGDWRADLLAVSRDTWAMTRRHPWYGALVHTRPPAGPHQLRRLELLLAVLIEQRATLAEAMTFAALVDRHILGSALQSAVEIQAERRLGLDDPARLVAALRATRGLAVAGGHRHLAAWLAEPTGPGPDEQFELGLAFLLDGIAARLLPVRAPAPVVAPAVVAEGR